MAGVVWLGEEACNDARRVGAKAANLSRLAAARVPPGFVVPALRADLEVIEAGVAEAVRAGYRALGERAGVAPPAVAVRSSALDEDGAEASFAGQHATFLNVTGEEAVLDAVMRCCASARTGAALAYRAGRGIGAADIRVAVLVQALVPADVSGVAFSANPVTGGRDEVVVNASWGLGESIVAGAVTPDTYSVGRDGAVARVVAAKRVMTVAVPGGTGEAMVEAALQDAACLSDELASEVASLARALEARMGWPVDLEFAVAGGELWLLQCRPITAL